MSDAVAFQSITGCDAEFAASFLAAHNGDLEQAVNAFMGEAPGGVPPPRAPATVPPEEAADPLLDRTHLGGLIGGGSGDDVREALPQYREQLMDPAQRMATSSTPMPATHHLEAFRDAKNDQGNATDAKHKSKTLADIYRPPTEMCFQGQLHT